ncbi:MAG: hypothetical protein HYX68_22810 [Planctomycetes bacterium]|nr:hypothetical protein [Planctomycetota bacterium]
MQCESCQQELLSYLYDLLDPPERAETAAHLEGCAECRDALATAQNQQGMLAEAVKAPGVAVVFKAPAAATPASTAPTVLMHRPPRRWSLINRWSAAAAVLFLTFTIGTGIGWSLWRTHTAVLAAREQQLAKAKETLNQTQQQLEQKKAQSQQEIRAIQEEIDKLFRDWKKEETKTRKALEDKQARVGFNLYGPRIAQAGAPHKYEVERSVVSNFAAPAPGIPKADVPGGRGFGPSVSQARVINTKTRAVLYQQALKFQANNRAALDLPVLPIKPGDDLRIEIQTETADGKMVRLSDNLPIVFPEYVTHLTTDRPLYRPGDTVRFRSLTLERFSLKPANQKFHLLYRVVNPRGDEIFRKEVASRLILGPNQQPLRGPGGQELHGLGVGEFALPTNLPTGSYTLFVSEVNERFTEEKRVFQVRRWQQPRFHKEVTFHRPTYGAGDQIKMQVRFTPVAGAQPKKGKTLRVNARVVIDGDETFKQSVEADALGRAAFEFSVPVQLHTGLGKVALEADDGGARESLVREIPLVVRDLGVEFFPEGGDLVAGAVNRVYFQVRTPAGKPAELVGRIVDENEQLVVRVQTVSDVAEPGMNQGMGVFSFTPAPAKRYRLVVDSPIGIERVYALPDTKDQGVVLSVPKGVPQKDIDVVIKNAGRNRALMVGAYCRGRMLDHQEVSVTANQSVSITLRPALGVGGVYRITVFEKLGPGTSHLRPLAERLIYRQRTADVSVAITPDRATYQPGDPVRLALEARNEKHMLTPTVALVAVVDAGLLKLASEKTARGLPTHFLLTTEVRDPEDLENADFFLGKHPRAAAALDLLLGCQGWRRFAEQDPQKFLQDQQRERQQKAPVFLSNSINPGAQILDADPQAIEKIDQQFVKTAIELQKKLATTESVQMNAGELPQRIAADQAQVRREQDRIQAAEQRLRELRHFFMQFGLGGAILTVLFLGFALVSMGLRRLSEGEGHPRRWLLAGGGLLVFLFLGSLVGTIAFMGHDSMSQKDQPKVNDALFPQVNAMPGQNGPRGGEPISRPEIEPRDHPEQSRDRAPGGIELHAAPNLEVINANAHANGLLPGQVEPAEQEDRRLRREGNYQALLLKALGRRVRMPTVDGACIVREYAHRRKDQGDGQRTDHASTIYWHPVLVMPNGKAEVRFDLSDSVTAFQVLVLSHTFDGRLGADSIELVSRLPFRVEPVTPTEISAQDRVIIPVMVRNDTPNRIIAALSASAQGLKISEPVQRDLGLPGNEPIRELFHTEPTVQEGEAVLRLRSKMNGYRDTVERRFVVVPDGIPVVNSISGLIGREPMVHTIPLPEKWDPGTLKVQAHFYPTPLAELTGALQGLQQEPTGGLEQAAARNYLNGMILDYLKDAKVANPPLEKNARSGMQTSLRRLATFECSDAKDVKSKGGFAWFNHHARPQAAATAYGFWQFRRLAAVDPVQVELLKRSERFLLENPLRPGGFEGKADSKKRFGQPPAHITNAYILWALTENGVKAGADVDLTGLRHHAKTQKDPYFLALVGLSHLNANQKADAIPFLQMLAGQQKENGAITGASVGITGSRGRDLDIETTALALLGWLKSGRDVEFRQNVHGAISWLTQQRRGAGTFGGPQATVLALQALIWHQKHSPRDLQPGMARLFVPRDNPGQGEIEDDQGKTLDSEDRLSFTPRFLDTLTLTLPAREKLRPGKNVIQLEMTGNNSMPYLLTWSYRVQKPANDPNPPIKLTATLDRKTAREGEMVKLSATIENVSGKGQGKTIAILGLPAGLALPNGAAQLKTFAAWEMRGRELVLHWTDLAPGAKVRIDLDLRCRIPGFFRGPAGRAYLAADAERKHWIEPLMLRIDPAE